MSRELPENIAMIEKINRLRNTMMDGRILEWRNIIYTVGTFWKKRCRNAQREGDLKHTGDIITISLNNITV